MQKKPILVTLALILAGALAFMAYRALIDSGDDNSYDEVLAGVANQMNASLPTMLDAETRLENTFAGPGNRFTYTNTLVQRTTGEFDSEALRTRLQEKITTNYMTHPAMEDFRSHGVELHYIYKDRDGAFVTEIIVNPANF